MSPRGLAWELCRLVDHEGAYANLAWEDLLRHSTLSREEKAFATHLAYGTMRHRGTIDAILREASGRRRDQVDDELWWVLQLGAHQWLWMTTPAHAAVNEAVTLAKKKGVHRGSGLVNAIMRKIVAHPLEYWLEAITAAGISANARLGLTHSHPEWLVDGFDKALAECEGTDEANLVELLESHNKPATIHLALLPGFGASQPSDSPLPYSPVGIAAKPGSPGNDPRVRNGVARVQDEGSQLAALVLADYSPVEASEHLLDMCSGPGGKAALLAARASEAGAAFTAVEKAPHRSVLVEKALAPMREAVKPPEVITGDADQVLSEQEGVFDRVLLDAPCTGAGALRRRPESRWRKAPEDLATLVDLQRRLLARAVSTVKPGGVVVYVTCSPLIDETTAQMAWLAAHHPVTLLDTPDIVDRVANRPLTGHRRGSAAQLWPHRHNTDAMFIQAFRRDL